MVAWESRDPVELWEIYLAHRKHDVEALRRETGERVEAVVADALSFAERSPFPEGPEAMEDLYATPVPGGGA